MCFKNKGLFGFIVKTEDIGTKLYAALTANTLIFIYCNRIYHLSSPKNDDGVVKRVVFYLSIGYRSFYEFVIFVYIGIFTIINKKETVG